MKPCPFCGQRAAKPKLAMAYVVYCYNCHGYGPARKTKDEAEQAWDKRPIEDELNKLLDTAAENGGVWLV